MNSALLIYLLFLHLVADFILQPSWMAINKSKCNYTLLTHCYVYMMTFILGTIVFGFSIIFALVNGTIHFPIDYITSRINSKLFKMEDKHWFYTSIACDQLIHTSTIILTYPLLYWYFITKG